MKKSFIIVLTVLIVLCSVSCDLNQIGNTMQSMNKNLFFPAKVDEVVVKTTVSDTKKAVVTDKLTLKDPSSGVETELGFSFGEVLASGNPSNISKGLVAMGQAASVTVDNIIALGNESVAEQKAVVEEMKATPAFAPDDERNLKGTDPEPSVEDIFKQSIENISLADIMMDLILDEEQKSLVAGQGPGEIQVKIGFLQELGISATESDYEAKLEGVNLGLLFEDFSRENDDNSETTSIVVSKILPVLEEPLGEDVATKLVNDLVVIINTIGKEVVGDETIGDTEFTVSVNDVLVAGMFAGLYNQMTSGLGELFEAIGDLNKTIKSFQLLLPDAADAIQDLYSTALSLLTQMED